MQMAYPLPLQVCLDLDKKKVPSVVLLTTSPELSVWSVEKVIECSNPVIAPSSNAEAPKVVTIKVVSLAAPEEWNPNAMPEECGIAE